MGVVYDGYGVSGRSLLCYASDLDLEYPWRSQRLQLLRVCGKGHQQALFLLSCPLFCPKTPADIYLCRRYYDHHSCVVHYGDLCAKIQARDIRFKQHAIELSRQLLLLQIQAIPSTRQRNTRCLVLP